MKYEFSDNPPLPIEDETYIDTIKVEFHRLLKDEAENENSFQVFFEQNPSYLPGAKGALFSGHSGHGPHLNTLITQPKLSGLAYRNPDFVWFAYDSVGFSPFFIEIEAPHKKYFNQDGTPTSNFTKARNQLDEWEAILSQPENILKFFTDFQIPQDLRSLHFEPHYILIYGRRSEYENKPFLKQKRGTLLPRTSRKYLMSYDRLEPQFLNSNFICCKVKEGRYIAKCLAPTFKLSVFADNLLEVEDLETAVDNMAFTTQERKKFLKNKLPHLLEFLKSPEDEKQGQTSLILDGRKLQFDE
jgi:hypothetical protein